MPTAYSPQVSLPAPEERPAADVLIFDGQCRFCLAQMQRLQSLDRGGRLAYVSLHDSQVAARWPELTHEELMRHMYVIDQNGGRHAGAAAFRYLSRRLPLLWWLAPLMHIPCSLPLWQLIYRQVARFRYRFGRVEECDDGSCKVHFHS